MRDLGANINENLTRAAPGAQKSAQTLPGTPQGAKATENHTREALERESQRKLYPGGPGARKSSKTLPGRPWGARVRENLTKDAPGRENH